MKLNIDKRLKPILDKVSDPEIPVLTILEMGVVRSAQEYNSKVYTFIIRYKRKNILKTISRKIHQ